MYIRSGRYSSDCIVEKMLRIKRPASNLPFDPASLASILNFIFKMIKLINLKLKGLIKKITHKSNVRLVSLSV